MTKYGFYSIVQKQAREYHVRARERKDVENLVRCVPLPHAQIKESERTDYAFRIVVGQADVLAILRFLGETLDYSNFKDTIDQIDDQKHKPYHKVWGVIADTLGAYGHKPIWQRRKETGQPTAELDAKSRASARTLDPKTKS